MTRHRTPPAVRALRAVGDVRAAQRGTEALAEHVAYREAYRAARRRHPAGKTATPKTVGVGGALAMLAALVLGVALTAATGWAGLAVGVVLFLGSCLFAGRGGRDGIRR